jgi:SAM-dependent methyltransferase
MPHPQEASVPCHGWGAAAYEDAAVTNAPAPETPRPDYGIDAPGVVRNLLLAGAAGLLVWATAALGLWSGVSFGVDWRWAGLSVGVACTATGAAMIWTSKVGKVRGRERLLDWIPWRGDEAVLDVGCGRGLLLLGAARRVPRGRATGVDIWQAEDLSGNRPEATLENSRREGVADRVEVRTADMRQLPFPDGTFDVVVSRAAIHNVYRAEERRQAVAEIARVLRPGGRVLISDIRHHGEYADELAKRGCTDVRRDGGGLGGLVWTVVSWGQLRPGTVMARRAE